jgi:hypothetical protein
LTAWLALLGLPTAATPNHRPLSSHHHLTQPPLALPGESGNYCQDVTVTKGATYKLSYYYGRLMAQFKK